MIKCILGIPDQDKPAPGAAPMVQTWVDALQKWVPRALTGALLSGLTPALLTFGAADGSLTQAAALSWNGSTLAITGAATVSTTLGVTGDATLSSRLGLGSLSTSAILNVSGNPLSGTTQVAMFFNVTGTSAGTANLRGVQCSLGTDASAYTLTQMTGFLCSGQTLGAGSTVTRFSGLHVTRSAIATNNAAISHASSTTPSFTGNWFLHNDTTDASYLGGALTINSGALTMSAVTGTTLVISSTSATSVTLAGGISIGGALTCASASPTFTLGDGTGTPVVSINGATATNRDITYRTAGSRRWAFRCNNTAEGGANAGSDFELTAFDDASASLGVWLTVARSSGLVTLGGALTVPGAVSLTTASSGLTISKTTGTTLVVSSTAAISATFAGGATFANAVAVTGASTGVISVGSADTTLAVGQVLGQLDFTSVDATAGANGIRATIAAIEQTGAGVTDLVFSNTEASSATLNERMRLKSTGNLLLGTTTDYGTALNVDRIKTLTGAIGSDISCIGVRPSYTGAFTVSRASYFAMRDPALAASAAVTDACVFYFDGAAGTHKAIDGATAKATPGTVNAWVKIDVNGTVYYVPAYTSKTT